VIQPTEADVVGPSVTADDPHRTWHQVVGQPQQFRHIVGVHVRLGQLHKPAGQLRHQLAAFCDRLGIGVTRRAQLAEQPGGQHRSEALEQRPDTLLLGVHAETHAETKLGVVLEQRVVPRGAASVGIGRVRGSRQVAAVDRGATRGVRHHQAIPVELGEQP
jgi:hypothetical protein